MFVVSRFSGGQKTSLQLEKRITFWAAKRASSVDYMKPGYALAQAHSDQPMICGVYHILSTIPADILLLLDISLSLFLRT